MRREKQPYWNQKVRNETGPAGTLTNQRGLRGSKLGPANEGRKLSPDERRKIEDQLRKEGKL
jgi:hypothetical protein